MVTVDPRRYGFVLWLGILAPWSAAIAENPQQNERAHQEHREAPREEHREAPREREVPAHHAPAPVQRYTPLRTQQHTGAGQPQGAPRGEPGALGQRYGQRSEAQPRFPARGALSMGQPLQPARGFHPMGASTRTVSQGPGGQVIVNRSLAGGGHVVEISQPVAGGTLHATRYGEGLNGVVERPTANGYFTRTFVQSGRVVSAHVYRHYSFERFGHSYAYEQLVPAVVFSPVYCAWAIRPWRVAITYPWRWWQPWYGAYFVPYPQYASLDLWMTDYILAQNVQAAYAAAQPPPAQYAASAPGQYAEPAAGQYTQPPPEGAAPMPPQSAAGVSPPTSPEQATPGEPAPPNAAPSPPQPEPSPETEGTTPSGGAPAQATAPPQPMPPGATARTSGPPSGGTRTVLTAAPPVIAVPPPPMTADVKAELNEQIKQQLAEQSPAEHSDQDLPDALKASHVLFRVVSPIDVPTGATNQFCSLNANDYIKRTGDMDADGTVPVQVKLSGPSDCNQGLVTRVALNDLMLMDSDQKSQLNRALLAASKNMGPGKLPQAPSTNPTLVAQGQAKPDSGATRTLAQM